MRLSSVRDSAGFDFGVVIQSKLNQTSVLLEAEQHDLSLPELTEWQDSTGWCEELRATAVIVHFGQETRSAQAVVSFSTDTTISKDEHSALASLAVQLPAIYAPAEQSWVWLQQDKEQLQRSAQRTWSAGTSELVFPPVAESFSETPRTVSCNDKTFITFEMESPVNDDYTEINNLCTVLSSLRGEEEISFIRIARPTDPTYLDAHPDSPRTRTAHLVVIAAADRQEAEACAMELIFALHPRTRLRLHRLLGRQRLGVLLAGGLPAYGWQHNTHIVTRNTQTHTS